MKADTSFFCTVPAPQVILALQVQNATYIGTVASLYCTVVLDSAVNTPVQVTTSIAASTSNNFTLANKLANNIYQSILVFSPLTSEDGNEYVCSAKVDSTNGYITRATGQAVYTLVPLGMKAIGHTQTKAHRHRVLPS